MKTIKPTPFLIGIDLGTTHCACYYIETQGEAKTFIQRFTIFQAIEEGLSQESGLLASYLYFPCKTKEAELFESSKMTWNKAEDNLIIGQFAKELYFQRPKQGIASAKSWLSHGGIDRKEPFLPLQGEGEKISPFEASYFLIEHLKQAWNRKYAKHDPAAAMEQQQVVITVPASFDEGARNLTLQAAKLAGIESPILLEEPQAAFYHYLAKNERTWQSQFEANDLILVVDIGGGTSDFSLIGVRQAEKGLELERRFVGDHLLLGGDNLDIALAKFLEKKALEQSSEPLTASQNQQLLYQARLLKERLYEKDVKQVEQVFLQARGSKLIAGGRKILVNSAEARTFLEEGFFALLNLEEGKQIDKKGALKTMGLPYEKEPSITKQLAHFLFTHAPSWEKEEKLKYVLFNGGTLKPYPFQQRILSCLKKWYGDQVCALDNQELDFAVAKGAAYFALSKQGKGVQIHAGAPRSLYLKIENTQDKGQSWMCICPKNTPFSTNFQVPQTFSLQVNKTVYFCIAASSIAHRDTFGAFYSFDAEKMQALPAMSSFLNYGRATAGHTSILVELHFCLNDLGLLTAQIKAKNSPHTWDLCFSFEAEKKQEQALCVQTFYDQQTLLEVKKKIGQLTPTLLGKQQQFLKSLEELMQEKKAKWSLPLLRFMADELLGFIENSERRTDYLAEHAFAIFGFLLRPGYGHPMDADRMKRLWRFLLQYPFLKLKKNALIQRDILIRRLAGGFSLGQQRQLGAELFKHVLSYKKDKAKSDEKSSYAFSEKLRACASLEKIEWKKKVQLGDVLLSEKNHSLDDATLWALARLGARKLQHGSISDAIPASIAEKWSLFLLNDFKIQDEKKALVLKQLCYEVDYSALNVGKQITEKLQAFLEKAGVNFDKESPQNYFTREETNWVLADELPSGLSLVSPEICQTRSADESSRDTQYSMV